VTTATAAQRVGAFFLSFFSAGTGQFFLGHTRRALAWLALGVIGVPLSAILIDVAGKQGHVVLPGIVFMVAALARPLSAFDTFAVAPAEKRPKTLWVVAWFVMALSAIVAAPVATRVFVLESFKVPAGSMMPTILVGDHLFVDKRAKSMRRGALLVFEYPENRLHQARRRRRRRPHRDARPPPVDQRMGGAALPRGPRHDAESRRAG
jgi:signal peptidase I